MTAAAQAQVIVGGTALRQAGCDAGLRSAAAQALPKPERRMGNSVPEFSRLLCVQPLRGGQGSCALGSRSQAARTRGEQPSC